MTRCKECNIVDLGVTKFVKNGEEYVLCPNCGAEDSVEEIDELKWAEEMAQIEADHRTDIFRDDELMEYDE